MTRAIVKAAVERLVASGPVGNIGRRRHRGRVLVLAYHNIVPDDESPQGDRSLHLSLSDFREQLDRLAETHDIVPLVDAVRGDQRRRPRAVITFDDAYRGAIVLGLDALRQRELPATVFVAPGLVDTSGFWWDRFAPDVGWPVDVRDRLLTECLGEESQVAEWAHRHGVAPRPIGEWLRPASELELTRAAGIAGVTFGSHSWDHPNLAALSPGKIETQLRDSITWLEQKFADVVRWVAYPYGLHAAAVERAAAILNFDGGLSISGGWWPTEVTNRYQLPRWNVPAGVSIAGFGPEPQVTGADDRAAQDQGVARGS